MFGKKWGSPRAAVPLGWDRARTAWQPDHLHQRAWAGVPREQGWGLVLCCVPVVDQSLSRDEINWEIVHLYL